MWLAHGTVSGGTQDCLVRPSTAAFPNRLIEEKSSLGLGDRLREGKG
jgi:hypothetical protein